MFLQYQLDRKSQEKKQYQTVNPFLCLIRTQGETWCRDRTMEVKIERGAERSATKWSEWSDRVKTN